MCRVPVFIGAVLLTASVFGQEPETSRNSVSDAYTRDYYNRPVEVGTGSGSWGWLGLLGLTGLLGLRRRETIVGGRDEF